MRLLLATLLVACATPRTETRIIVVRQLCESKYEQPAVACGAGQELAHDGCRWGCRLQQQTVHFPTALSTYDISAVQTMNLCASPNYCEGK